MSIVVLGMEMPGSCAKCRIKYWINNDPYCPIIKSSLKWNKYSSGEWTGVDKRCPLRPLPDKHGRLIDADDMERFMSDTVQGDIRQYPYSDTLWDMAFKWIDSRPTIVEAEGD